MDDVGSISGNFKNHLAFIQIYLAVDAQLFEGVFNRVQHKVGVLSAVHHSVRHVDLLSVEGLQFRQVHLALVLVNFVVREEFVTAANIDTATLGGGHWLAWALGAGLLFDQLSSSFLRDLLGAVSELNPNLICSGDGSLHPLVTNHICKRKSGNWVQLQHVCDEIFELFTKEISRLVAGVLFPEKVCLALAQKFVVGIVGWVGRVEWRMSTV